MNRPAAGLDYVRFGHSALFGDYVDIIHANGGRLLKVVTNLPDLPRPGDGRRFADDLAAMNGWLAHAKGAPEIARQDIDALAPAAGETYLIGFRGEQLRPLRDRLKKDFGLVFSALCHPAAAISPTAGIGEGAIIGANSVLGSFSQAGEFCLLGHVEPRPQKV